MDEFIKLLDTNLNYIKHEISDNICNITVESNRQEAKCPFCSVISTKVHSVYSRGFQDLPIQGKKVNVIIRNRKMLCKSPNCEHKTFAERFEFISKKAKKTKRLEDEIARLALNCSSIAASEILKRNVVDVGKSTICNLLKKRNSGCQ